MHVFGYEPVAAIPHLRSKEIKVTANTRHSPWVTPKLNRTEHKTMGLYMCTSFSKRNAAAVLLGLAIASVGLTDVALAGFVPVPGPIAGAGLPALAVAGGALWLFRKIRSPRQ